MHNDICIRKATGNDLEAVFPMIDRENWYWTELEVARVLKIGKTHSLVAVRNDEIVGILFVLRNTGFATWTHFIVKEEYRGSGIGRQLIEYNLDEFGQTGVEDVDIIAVSNKVDYYEKFGFHLTEEILCYEMKAVDSARSGSTGVSNHCRTVCIQEIQTTGALTALEKHTGCSLGTLTGGLFYDSTSPAVGYYEDSVLKGIMLTHVAPKDIDLGPWLMEDITPQIAHEMLWFTADLTKGKNIGVSISSENKLAKALVASEKFDLTDKLARMVRSIQVSGPLSENLVCIGKF